MIRDEIRAAHAAAIKGHEKQRVRAIRQILAALADRDIELRATHLADANDDLRVIDVLQRMIKERERTIALYDKLGRADAAQGEQEEVIVIEGFLPSQDGAPANGEDGASEAPIPSSSWVGLPSDFRLSEPKRQAIVSALDMAEEALSGSSASQHNQAQARAYIIAARALLEAPDPEPELAWELLGRASNLAGIASLFVAIVALFLAR